MSAAKAQMTLFDGIAFEEDPNFLQEQLVTYIGNKRALLPFIGNAVAVVQRRLSRDRLNTLDLFSGSGVVARYLKQYSDLLIVNDFECYSRVVNECFLTNYSMVNIHEVDQAILWVREQISNDQSPGFICDMYAPRDESAIDASDRVFYTRRNATYLDSARRAIGKLPPRMQVLLLGPLLSRASVHANTSGVFKGFYKNAFGVGQFGGNNRDALVRICGEIAVERPILSRYECEHRVYQEDANRLVRDLPEVDLAYFDPPYNQHPYGSNYFMLNLLVDYQRPKEVSRVSGIPENWQRSRYNQRKEASKALFSAIQDCKAKYVLISYNSEGFVAYEEFLSALQHMGSLTVLETPYNTFRGSRNLRDRSIHVTEFLYLLEK